MTNTVLSQVIVIIPHIVLLITCFFLSLDYDNDVSDETTRYQCVDLFETINGFKIKTIIMESEQLLHLASCRRLRNIDRSSDTKSKC
jgi:hypothetical protein